MKIRSIFRIIIIFSTWINCQAQNIDKEILMTVEGRKVEAGEFIRMYNKSPEEGAKTNVDTFLRQFINFKLKVADAISEGYDTTRKFRDELAGYRTQLAQGYLTDNDIKDKMLQEAFRRSQIEVKASHILISCPPNASTEDTLKAFDRALEIRNRILNGEPFEKVADEVSDDRSVRMFHGNLGYFTVFQMIKPFEDAAYALEPGTLSMPVRTSFGYHIILVTGKQPSRGKIKVAHIMKSAPSGSPDSVIRNSKHKIDSIYLLLRNGESFGKLAAEYSDDRASAAKGGQLNPFGAGEIIPDFLEAAFALKDTGDFSQPIRTIYGFHIIKLLEKYPPPSFEESKPYLESKIKQYDITAAGKNSFVSRLKKEYNLNINEKALQWIVSNTDSVIVDGKVHFKAVDIPVLNIFSFADQNLTCKEFIDYLENSTGSTFTTDHLTFINKMLESFIAERILKYEDSILEEKYPDFRYLMDEFHDGILLFDISSDKVWNKGQEDSTELRNYYANNRNKFLVTQNKERPEQLPFDEVKAEVLSAYQDWLTTEWMKQLTKKYTVKIDNRVLRKVRNQLNNE
jgi:peptidyl-prolyl cis-trans isomerase SurA